MIERRYVYVKRRVRCKICGSETETTSCRSVMCEDCAKELERERQRRRHARLYTSKAARVKLLYDPLPYDIGGFKTGATFDYIDLVEGLRYGSFRLGTVISLDNQRMIVKMKKGKKRPVIEAEV